VPRPRHDSARFRLINLGDIHDRHRHRRCRPDRRRQVRRHAFQDPRPELGAAVIVNLLERAKLTGDQIGEVILGQVLAAGSGQNPARQSVVKSGLPQSVPALTINAVCGSGLKAVMLAAQAIRDGDYEIGIAGGQENMSLAPHVLAGSRDGQRMGDWKLVDSMIVDGLFDVYNKYHMGITAENVAKKYDVSREKQDALALASQQKAAAAQEAGKFKDEIVPFSIPQKKGDPVVFTADEFINKKTSAEALAGLRPAFDKAGSVTAGNASGINDGAAGVVVMTAKKAEQLGLTPLARIASYATVAPRSGLHGHGTGAGFAEGAAAAPAGSRRISTCSRSTRPSRRRPAPSTTRWAGTPARSTSTAARSRSGIRSAHPAAASS
jgi:acetyl-CoA C-acetyltransferase